MVQELAGKGDFEEFCRFMYSVSRFGNEIDFNFIHPQTLIPYISPAFRPLVKKFFDGLFNFESSSHLMKHAERSLKQMGLEAIDDSLPTIALAQWRNTVRRLTFLILHQKSLPRYLNLVVYRVFINLELNL